jgi:hypothetical protein
MPGVLLAYKFVATAVMLLEINYCASQLHLPLNLPVRENEIKNLNLLNPTYVGFLGSIDAKNYTFSFIKSGRLCYIIKRDHPYYKFEGGTTKSRAYFEGLTQKKSLMDTEKAK